MSGLFSPSFGEADLGLADNRARMAMIDAVYNTRILEFAGNIPHIGRLEAADATATRHAKLCGSKVTVDLMIADGVVTGFAHDVKACALGQASSSIMARNIIGCTYADLMTVRDEMAAMLAGEDVVPSGRFSDLGFLQPVRDFKARHASTMLTFEAVLAAFEAYRTSREH